MAEHDWLSESGSGVHPAYGEVPGRMQPIVRHELRPLTTGEILDRTFFLYRPNFWLYVGLASLAAGVNVLTSMLRLVYLHFKGIPVTSPNAIYVGLAFTIVGLIVYFAVYCVTHAATVSAVASIYLGERTSMGEALDAVKGHWLRYCLIAMWQSWSAGWIFLVIFTPLIFVSNLAKGNLAIAALVASLAMLLAFAGAAYGLIAYIRNSLAIPAAVMENLSVR